MNRPLAAMFLTFAVSGGLVAQNQTPDLLIHAAQCLAARDFLPRTKATVLSFGYLLDVKSYPGQKVLYIVHYTSSDRSKGMAFSVFLSQRQGRQAFSVQNNATWFRTKDGVEFTKGGDPLGGIWTQQHLVSAIKKIERRSRINIPAKDLLAPSPLIQCESYADN